MNIGRQNRVTTSTPRSILVAGAGHFGTCLAHHLGELGHQVQLWDRDPSLLDAIARTGKNPKYFSDITLSQGVAVTKSLPDGLAKSPDAFLVVVPAQALRSVLASVAAAQCLAHSTILICAAKGIETASLKLPTDLILEVLGPTRGHDAVFLSGPSFASEVMRHQPTVVVAASRSAAEARKVQDIFHSPHFRVYRSSDVIGVEVGGALKNAIAIAAGACDGLGFEMNARAALLTRGLAEISRMGIALGAQSETFAGLSGMGDLILTCSSDKSRNFRVGYRLAKGESLESIVRTLGSVAEGVPTTRAAWELSQRLGVAAPIIESIYRVLYEGMDVRLAVRRLLERTAGEEVESP